VFLEITSRSGHSLTNGHVAKKAIQLGARLVISTDTHAPENLITDVMANTVLQGAGLTHEQAMEVFENNRKLLEKMRAKSES
jgi:histidinol phosphatase-like PHP family hydrolase